MGNNKATTEKNVLGALREFGWLVLASALIQAFIMPIWVFLSVWAECDIRFSVVITPLKYLITGSIFVILLFTYLSLFVHKDIIVTSYIISLFANKVFKRKIIPFVIYILCLPFLVLPTILAIHHDPSLANPNVYVYSVLFLYLGFIAGRWMRSLADADLIMMWDSKSYSLYYFGFLFALVNLTIVTLLSAGAFILLVGIFSGISIGYLIQFKLFQRVKHHFSQAEWNLIDHLIGDMFYRIPNLPSEISNGNRFLLLGDIGNAEKSIHNLNLDQQTCDPLVFKAYHRLRYRILFRMEKYNEIISSDFESNPNSKLYSATLQSLYAMALYATGEHKKAIEHLESTIGAIKMLSNKRKPSFRFLNINLAFLYYKSSDVDKAIRFTEIILKDMSKDISTFGNEGTVALNNLAYYYAERFRLSDKSMTERDVDLIIARARAESVIRQTLINGYPQVLHTAGYVCLLSAAIPNNIVKDQAFEFRRARKYFEEAILISSHRKAHLHLGIMQMLSNVTYKRAEYNLMSVVYYSNKYSGFLYKEDIDVALRNLELIKMLRNEQTMLNSQYLQVFDNPEIINIDTIPDYCIENVASDEEVEITKDKIEIHDMPTQKIIKSNFYSNGIPKVWDLPQDSLDFVIRHCWNLD